MTAENPQTIYLKDYQAPAYLVDHVALEFDLHPTATRVRSTLKFRPNPDNSNSEFFLHGENLTFLSAYINGAAVTPIMSEAGLTCNVPDGPFIWQSEVEINPSANTELSGLYMSNGMFCTQCEAEGFRRITYYPDRPDVMAPFDVTVRSELPYALSNGEPMSSDGTTRRWQDPWPKPAYLFALVAGEFQVVSDHFTTASGKPVDLNIYVRDGDQDKCDFALEALKASMAWDERVYGREYDLSVFNIVAVDDFNMGAMENKGLNIFNSSAVLASPETTVDGNFERIEAIIAHEYFHNWTGNRITCRDWFQLSLKEGLTVFRDQQFSADMRGAEVRRIEDVTALRARQFREDSGPLAHPVRPESFVEINNFYTATVYEKGAELIRMLKLLVGDAAYKEALELYFARHDGQACTIEDWLAVFTDVTGQDLRQFKLWYSQAGTPIVTVRDHFADGIYKLTLTQVTPPTPGQPDKHPLVIPIALGLLYPDGTEALATELLVLSDAEQSFCFSGLRAAPIPSLLRGFSAPVILQRKTSPAEHLVQLTHDPDLFNRFEASRELGKSALLAMLQTEAAPDDAYCTALLQVMVNEDLDPAFRAMCCTLPSQDEIAKTLTEQGQTPDPVAIDAAFHRLSEHVARQGQDALRALYHAHQLAGPFSPDAASCGARALSALALRLISYVDGGTLAAKQFATATTMSLQLPALGNLNRHAQGSEAISQFYQQWRNERLVIDKWFSLQVSTCPASQAVSVARNLLQHPDFTLKNPNRFRALVGALAMTPAAFHQADGSAYALVVDQLIALDDINPQLCARMTTVFETWRRYDGARQELMRAALCRLAAKPNLSRDTKEMVTRLMDA
ncbi:aminopeptidase N [uncultured Planktomarina sp.]|uniref:aminopeptidase N n=1 Tax=uncultured Planktomarina sp. TaxID=1538529 RepID=UPI003260E792